MPRNPYPSDNYVSTEEVGTKYNMNWLINKLKLGESLILSNNNVTNEDKLQALAITSVLFFTGARISEVLILKWKDINFDIDKDAINKWIILQLRIHKQKPVKPHPVRQVPIYAEKDNPFYFVFNWLSDYLIFYNNNIEVGLVSKQLKDDDVYNLNLFTFNKTRYYNWCIRYFNINPHGFRKILAQYMVVEKNMPLKTVQKIMGHSSLIPLDYYINMRTDDLKRDILNAYKK